MKIIIYGSGYGTAKAYADELGKRTGIPVVAFNNVENIEKYGTIIYIGALYAGGVLGMKKTFENLKTADGKNIVIATVGLADSTDAENIRNIENSMKTQLSKEIFESAKIFYLRGGLDYSKPGFKHKVMMSLLYKKASGIPAEKRNAETQAMIDTYNKKVSFIDFDALSEIETEINCF
ncbi:MAG: flavodoxin domain-containing protein [Oscillospiraceae bacterium]|nr:flavodoxin domain-containing protein [Oscillospiraceae bacterium]